MPIKFSDERMKEILAAIEEYAAERLEIEIGDLQARLLYEFMLGLLGAAAYNQGVADAQAYLQNKLIDMEIDLHEQVRYKIDDGEQGD